jgi:hypothetical protein
MSCGVVMGGSAGPAAGWAVACKASQVAAPRRLKRPADERVAVRKDKVQKKEKRKRKLIETDMRKPCRRAVKDKKLVYLDALQVVVKRKLLDHGPHGRRAFAIHRDPAAAAVGADGVGLDNTVSKQTIYKIPVPGNECDKILVERVG